MYKISLKIVLGSFLLMQYLKSVTIINKSLDILDIYINDNAINLTSRPVATLLRNKQFKQDGIVQVRIMGKILRKGNFYNMLDDGTVIEFNFNKSVIKR